MAFRIKVDEELEALYRHYNRKYFANKLPKHTLVGWASRMSGPTTIAEAICMIGMDPAIRIRRKISDNNSLVRMSMLHEMVHIKLHYLTPGGHKVEHGPRFQAEMLRLAKKGAFAKLW